MTHDGGRVNFPSAAYTFIHLRLRNFPPGGGPNLDVTGWLRQQLAIAWRDFLQHNPPEGEQGEERSDVDTPEDADVQTITVSVIKGELAFDKTTFTVEAGKPVRMVFENADLLQHNLLLLKPGTLDDTSWLAPVAQVWTDSAQLWLDLADLASFPRQPADIAALLER